MVVGILVAVLGPRDRPRRGRTAARLPRAPHRRHAVGRAHGLRRHRARPRAARPSSRSPARWPTWPSPALGARRHGDPAVAGIASSRGRSCSSTCCWPGFNLLPGLPLDGGQLVQSLVWGVTRPPRPRARRRRLVRSAARRGGRPLATSCVRWPRAPPTCSASGWGWSWPGSSGRAPPRRCGAPRSSGCCAGCGPRTSSTRWRSCPPPPRSVSCVGIGRRVVSLDERGRPDPAAARAVGDHARHRRPAPDHAAVLARRQAARRVRRRARTGRRRRAGAAGDGEHRRRASSWSTSAGTVRGLVTSERLNAVAERPCSAATRLRRP